MQSKIVIILCNLFHIGLLVWVLSNKKILPLFCTHIIYSCFPQVWWNKPNVFMASNPEISVDLLYSNILSHILYLDDF